ncbi:MAG: nucleotidyl transferase AbiEii/AbiGii toxin family protein [Bacteroidales bacterium]|nr:nucleotidyl transferase AbiEii/AbiGii toxin family protein [Bacteroidales bacterium]MBN2633775.1 nucleotidyl transferase AbiEii/AbiGii toxin family protein [Bacteroidales bacterium]
MTGLAKKTAEIIEPLSRLYCLAGYTLTGGTALSLQINKRKSEDLDFCIWTTNLKKEKPEVAWPLIEKELSTIGKVTTRDILGFDQVNFIVNGVKLTFMTKQNNLSPVKTPVKIVNNIKAADIQAIGAMKIELILRRSEFRDYYDIYSILMEGLSLKDLVERASVYSNRLLKVRNALSFLADGSNYRKDKSFNLLEPYYDIDNKGIEEYMRAVIKKEFGK